MLREDQVEEVELKLDEREKAIVIEMREEERKQKAQREFERELMKRAPEDERRTKRRRKRQILSPIHLDNLELDTSEESVLHVSDSDGYGEEDAESEDGGEDDPYASEVEERLRTGAPSKTAARSQLSMVERLRAFGTELPPLGSLGPRRFRRRAMEPESPGAKRDSEPTRSSQVKVAGKKWNFGPKAARPDMRTWRVVAGRRIPWQTIHNMTRPPATPQAPAQSFAPAKASKPLERLERPPDTFAKVAQWLLDPALSAITPKQKEVFLKQHGLTRVERDNVWNRAGGTPESLEQERRDASGIDIVSDEEGDDDDLNLEEHLRVKSLCDETLRKYFPSGLIDRRPTLLEYYEQLCVTKPEAAKAALSSQRFKELLQSQQRERDRQQRADMARSSSGGARFRGLREDTGAVQPKRLKLKRRASEASSARQSRRKKEKRRRVRPA